MKRAPSLSLPPNIRKVTSARGCGSRVESHEPDVRTAVGGVLLVNHAEPEPLVVGHVPRVARLQERRHGVPAGEVDAVAG